MHIALFCALQILQTFMQKRTQQQQRPPSSIWKCPFWFGTILQSWNLISNFHFKCKGKHGWDIMPWICSVCKTWRCKLFGGWLLFFFLLATLETLCLTEMIFAVLSVFAWLLLIGGFYEWHCVASKNCRLMCATDIISHYLQWICVQLHSRLAYTDDFRKNRPIFWSF